MSDEAIPEDVLRAAKNEAEHFAAWLHAGNSTGSLSQHAVEGLSDSVARAILAEREHVLAEVAKYVDQITLADIASSIRSSHE